MSIIAVSIAQLFADDLIKNKRDLFTIGNTGYFIANPAHLRVAHGQNATDSMYKIISTKTDSFLILAGMRIWKKLPSEHLRQLTMAFDQAVDRKTGEVDSVPYVGIEACKEVGLKHLAVFYFYRPNPNEGIIPDGDKVMQSPITTKSDPNSHPSTIRVGIALKNIQYCCALYDTEAKQKMFFIGTDDEDYISCAEIVEKLFSKFGFQKSPDVARSVMTASFKADHPMMSQFIEDAVDKRQVQQNQEQIRTSKAGTLQISNPTSSQNLTKKGSRGWKALKEILEFNYGTLIDPFCNRIAQLPAATQHVSVRLGVDGDGKVVNPAITSSTIPDSSFNADFIQALAKVNFDPMPSSSDTVFVEVPFSFSRK